MIAARRAALGASQLLFVVGCAAPTELVVVVATDLEPVRQVDSVSVSITNDANPTAAQTIYSRPLSDGTGDGGAGRSFPLRLVLAPASASVGAVTLRVSALAAGRAVVTQTVHARFSPGGRLEIPVRLSRSCAGVTCPAADDPALDTCDNGACARLDSSTSATPWTGTPSVTLDAGAAPTIEEVALGGDHSCARTSAGAVFCWGANDMGQGGRAPDPRFEIPRAVPVPARVQQLTAGVGFTCALLESKQVACWGDNAYGVLGDGRSGELDAMGLRAHLPTATPQIVEGLSMIRQVAAGQKHMCVVTMAGEARCWGANDDGRAGTGSVAPVTARPTAVVGLDNVAKIAPAEHHTCALTATGDVYCWGSNTYGQLGNGMLSAGASAPARVPSLSGISDISSGAYHTCVRRMDRRVLCWGRSRNGQVGDGRAGMDNVIHTPTIVAGVDDASSVSCGEHHTCVLSDGQGVSCFGANAFGQSAQPPSGGASEPDVLRAARVRVASADLLASRVVSGLFHSCAITSGRSALYCWGRSDSGQLGDGTTEHRFAPARVRGGL